MGASPAPAELFFLCLLDEKNQKLRAAPGTKKRTDLVHLCCCNKIPLTRSLINKRNVFLRVLEAGSPRARPQHVWRLVRAWPLLPKWPLWLSPHLAEEVEDAED